jgi:release factor glutamine methyltransferase
MELSRKAAAVLAERGFENARLDAELLLAGVLGVRRLDLYLQHDRPLTPEELERFRACVRRRLRHEPLQYILGRAAFRQLELAVDPRVLIPRPETEVLVGAVLAWAAGRPAGGSVLDMGTGSGAIALSLAAEGRFERVVASDVSAGALAVARANASHAGLQQRVEFRQGDLFAALRGEAFDAVVSNPPYVAEHERQGLQPEVRDHEPADALFAGSDGLSVIGELVRQAPAHVLPGGLLALEIGLGQDARVLALVEATGAFCRARVLPDLTGRPRIVLAERLDESEHVVEGTT